MLSFFPVNAGFLAWLALVPLLSLVRANARPRRIYFAAFVGGLVCYVPAIQWMRVAHPAMYASWLFLAFCCALFLAMSLWLARQARPARRPVLAGGADGLRRVEYFRSHFPTGYTWLETVGLRHPIGFGWYMLGHTQHDWLSVIQIVGPGRGLRRFVPGRPDERGHLAGDRANCPASAPCGMTAAGAASSPFARPSWRRWPCGLHRVRERPA